MFEAATFGHPDVGSAVLLPTVSTMCAAPAVRAASGRSGCVTRLAGDRLRRQSSGRTEDSGDHCGLQTMCEFGGMADAILIERL